MIKASPHKLWEFYGTDFALRTYPVVPECLQNGVRKYNAQFWGQYVPVVNFVAQKGRRSWEMLPPFSVFKVFFKPELRLTDTSKYFQKKLNYCGYRDLQLFLKCSKYHEPSKHGDRNHNFAFFAYILIQIDYKRNMYVWFQLEDRWLSSKIWWALKKVCCLATWGMSHCNSSYYCSKLELSWTENHFNNYMDWLCRNLNAASQWNHINCVLLLKSQLLFF